MIGRGLDAEHHGDLGMCFVHMAVPALILNIDPSCPGCWRLCTWGDFEHTIVLRSAVSLKWHRVAPVSPLCYAVFRYIAVFVISMLPQSRPYYNHDQFQVYPHDREILIPDVE